MIELQDGYFIINGKPFFVYSGELHYFRLPPKLWPLHLKRAKEAGLNTVSTYIPWSWHEAKEGQFDFTGRTHPQKNLKRYLEEVNKAGLKFIARIGPVSNAELVNEGIPGWLLENYPEVFVRGKEVTNLPHVTLLSYHNDTFQKYVGKWYDKVLPILHENEYPNGPLILVQLDNEIGMVHWLNKAADYSPNTEKMYREFLKDKYSNITALNRAYHTSHADFSAVRQPSSGADTQNKNLLWDWMSFYQQYYARYYQLLFKHYNGSGVSLPVLANIPQFYDFDVRGRGVFSPMTTMMFRDFPQHVPKVIFGGAYQMRRLDYENFHDISITTEVVKMITSPGVPSICAELQTGIMRDRPRLYAPDVELNLKSCMGHGLNALNCYMFSGGKNEPEFGAFGTYHEWQAPVNSAGQKQDHFPALAEFGDIVKTFGVQVSSTKKKTDTTIGFYPYYYTTEYLTGPLIEAWEWKKMQLFYDGLARLLQVTNLNYSFADLQKTSVEELKQYPSLWVFTMDFMDADTQDKLVAYVKQGGTLVLNPGLPEKDQMLEKCTILADYLLLRTETTIKKNLFFYIGKQDYLAQGEINTFTCPKNAEAIATTREGKACGIRIARDKGQVLLLGFGLNHMFDYHADLVRYFAKTAGVKPSVEVSKDLHAVLRTGGDHGFLFLANYHDAVKSTKVRLIIPGENKSSTFPSSGEITLSNRRCYVIPLNVPLPSGDRIRYAAGEILTIKESNKSKIFDVRGEPGTIVEIELKTDARRASLDGKKIPAVARAGALRIRFEANGARQRLEIS